MADRSRTQARVLVLRVSVLNHRDHRARVDTMAMNGLHSCKPANAPQVGQVKTFVVIQNPATDTKKAWTKIKSAGAEQGGTPYKITAVKPTGFTDSYGNISFNLDIEPATAQEGQTPSAAAPPQRPSGNGGSYGWRSPETQARIERQHSQEMALRLVAMEPGLIAGKPVDMKKLRWFIDWFQKDIENTPGSDSVDREERAERSRPHNDDDPAGELPPDDEEIPF